MEKQIKNVLKNLNISSSNSKILTQMVQLKKEELNKTFEEKRKIVEAKSVEKISQLQNKISEIKKGTEEKLDKEIEKVLEKEIKSHMKYLNIKCEKVVQNEPKEEVVSEEKTEENGESNSNIQENSSTQNDQKRDFNYNSFNRNNY